MSEKENPQTASRYVVQVEYDVAQNRAKLKADGVPTVMLLGILEYAKLLVTKKQVEEQLKIDATRALAVGGRKQFMAGKAAELRCAGVSGAELEKQLIEFNKSTYNPPLDEGEMRNIAESFSKVDFGPAPVGAKA